MDQGLLTTVELARRLQVTPETILRWTRDGYIPCIRVRSKTIRYQWSAVLKALRGQDESEDQLDGTSPDNQ